MTKELEAGSQPAAAPHPLRSATTVGILSAARELIARPDGWTQGAFARDREGFSRSEYSQDAVCFCLSGAMHLAGHLAPWPVYRAAQDALRTQVDIPIPFWNDEKGRTQAEAVALLDAAISTFAKA